MYFLLIKTIRLAKFKMLISHKYCKFKIILNFLLHNEHEHTYIHTYEHRKTKAKPTCIKSNKKKMFSYS